jgi:hypothetical protein
MKTYKPIKLYACSICKTEYWTPEETIACCQHCWDLLKEKNLDAGQINKLLKEQAKKLNES